jgi:hypothetical protein
MPILGLRVIAVAAIVHSVNAFNLTLFALTNCTVNQRYGFTSYSVPVGTCVSLAPTVSAIAYTCDSTSIFSMFFSSACTPGTDLYGNWSIPVGNLCYSSPVFGFQITSCAPMASPTPSPSLPAPPGDGTGGFATGTLYSAPSCNDSTTAIPLGSFLRNGCTQQSIGPTTFSVIAACGKGTSAESRSLQVRFTEPFCNASQFDPISTYFFSIPSNYKENDCIPSLYPLEGVLSLKLAGCDAKSSSSSAISLVSSLILIILSSILSSYVV